MNLNLGFFRKGSRLPRKGGEANYPAQQAKAPRHIVTSGAEKKAKGIHHHGTTSDEELLARLTHVKVTRVRRAPNGRPARGTWRKLSKPFLDKRGGWDRAYFGANGQGEYEGK